MLDSLSSSIPSSLFLVNFYNIIVLHFQLFWCFIIVNPSTIKEESERGHRNAHTLTVTLFKLSHLCTHFDPEVNFITILSNHLQLDVLRTSIVVLFSFLIIVRHDGARVCTTLSPLTQTCSAEGQLRKDTKTGDALKPQNSNFERTNERKRETFSFSERG